MHHFLEAQPNPSERRMFFGADSLPGSSRSLPVLLPSPERQRTICGEARYYLPCHMEAVQRLEAPALVPQRDQGEAIWQDCSDKGSSTAPAAAILRATFKHKSDLEMSDILLNYPHVGCWVGQGSTAQRNVIFWHRVKRKSGPKEEDSGMSQRLENKWKTFNQNLILLFFIQDSSREALHKSVSKYLFAQEKKKKTYFTGDAHC